MSGLNRRQYLHQVLCTNQSTATSSTYLDQFGLFLDEEKTSKLEVIVSTSSPSHDRLGGALDVHPRDWALVEHPTTLGESQNCEATSPEHIMSTMTISDVINTLFEAGRTGFTMIHIGHVEHSRSRLQITRSCFERLVQRAGAFEAVKDTILHAGSRNYEIEVAPPRLRHAKLMIPKHVHGVCSHEMSYGIRYIQRNGTSQTKPWSLRQFFMYNKTDFEKRDSRWIVFALPEIIRVQVDTYLQNARQDAASNPLDIHVILSFAAIKTWRPYFVDLTKQIEMYRRRVENTDLKDRDSVQELGSALLGMLKNIEMDIVDALLALRATKDTLERIKSIFEHTTVSDSPHRQTLEDDGQDIITQAITDQSSEVDMLVVQATSLLQKIRGLSSLHAQFLSLVNGYSLTDLTEQQADEGKEIKKLTKIATDDTKAVKALSVIALIYLPITVVFNFFSTQFVDNKEGHVQVVGHWWLLVAVTVPLTVFTLFIWFACILRKRLSVRELGSRGPEAIPYSSGEDNTQHET